MTASTTVRSLSNATVKELEELLRRHREQLFGHLASYAAQHHLRADAVAELLGPGSDVAADWKRWAAAGPECICTPAFGSDQPVAPRFDCPAHGDALHRNTVRIRLATP